MSLVSVLTLGVASELYEVSCPETGEPRERDRFFVTAEAPDGRRWRHEVSFPVPQLGFAGAQLGAERLCNRVCHARAFGEWAGPVNSPHWFVMPPAYGSAAHEANWRETETQLDG